MDIQENVENIIFNILRNIGDELELDELKNPTLDTELYGINGNLDSLGLVSLIADLEESLNLEYNKQIILANEKAMSSKNSPFKNVYSLKEYIVSLLKK